MLDHNKHTGLFKKNGTDPLQTNIQYKLTTQKNNKKTALNRSEGPGNPEATV